MYPVAGIRLGTCAAGIRRPGRPDLVVIDCAPGTKTAATFTQNQFCAAPVLLARAHLSVSAPRALLINTGYANAGTGKPGYQDALACCTALAGQMRYTAEQILPFSTGVIGERLPVERMVQALPACIAALSESGWEQAAHGIMTTDTMAKGSSRQVDIDGTMVTMTGIAKGAGMIQPNMATMLAFVATDAAIDDDVLQSCLVASVQESFNRITVDGDTSTNDACVLLASGRAGNAPIIKNTGRSYVVFAQALREIFIELAQALVRDAEGATKFITIEVAGGRSEAECAAVANMIANSPLVKAAFFAGDPNWGRVLAAIGNAPIDKLDTTAVSIYLNNICVFSNGGVAKDYRESDAAAVMRLPEITVRVTLGNGAHQARVWTCDLSHEYIRINGAYRS
jgi:glutamate N-acetyltransferase/amino-acid N-acetyltransferase